MANILLKSVLFKGGKRDILIQGNKFAKIGEGLSADDYPNAEVVDCEDFAIVPAFYNGHCHAAMTLLRGYADDMPLMKWLQEYIWPFEAKMQPRDIEIGTRLAILEMIKSGTVFFSDMYWHREQTIKVVEEMGMTEKTIAISPVGCAVFAYKYIDVDWQEAAHGRAPALASAAKRLWPDRLVFTYQGDGDLACIGTAETIHALNRAENITIIFINNAIYGMTGGQMAPTTLLGMKTATCPYGREVSLHGYPLKITELAANLDGTCYVTRQSVHSVAAINRAKKAIRKAFEYSMQGKGSNLVEIVSTCNSGWKMSPEKANKWMEENMFAFYHIGDLKDTGADK